MDLRFLAKLRTDKPEDKDRLEGLEIYIIFRVFIITLSLNDDSLLVYEPTVRNSGIYDETKHFIRDP